MNDEEPRNGRKRALLWILLALAYLLRIAFVVDYEHHHPLADRPVIDEASYERWGLEVAAGDLIGEEVFFQEPLYAYGLGLIYAVTGPPEGARASARQRTAVRHSQAFLGVLSVLFAYGLTRRLFGGSAALVAALALALYRPLLAFPAYLLKPNLFVPWFLGVLWWWVALGRKRGAGAWCGFGAVSALGALLRGNVLGLLPFFLVLSAWRARTWRVAASALFGMLLVLGPVALRNRAVGGVWALTTTGAGTNLYAGNNPENPYGVATELAFVRGIPEYELTDWTHEAERRLEEELDAGAVSRYWLVETWRSFQSDPALHLTILARKLRLVLGRYEVPDNHFLDWDARFVGSWRLPFPGFAVVGWFGLAGALFFVIRRPGRDRFGGFQLLSMAALYGASVVLTVVSMRVRLPLVALLAPFAGLLVTRLPWVGTRLARLVDEPPAVPSGRELATALACLALCAPAVFWPVFDERARSEDLAERDFNHATYLLETEQGLEEARSIAEVLAATYPGSSRVETLLAEIAYIEVQPSLAAGDELSDAQLARLRTALQRLRAVVENPGPGLRERARARRLAGLIQLQLGNGESAERHFLAALDFDPDDRFMRLSLANAIFLRALDAQGEARSALLQRCEALLAQLAADGPSLQAEIEAARFQVLEARG